ncbi:lantibiotic dehydratase C-terminal domain-containing protein [Streptomyces sp. 4N509B]|uniref:lantibiotic dehydratase C-terminal domain-containing protein n=1 Tax=Streptomyces sp. 4N509B TaxID=3457413 RepID=UPI003FCEF6EA
MERPATGLLGGLVSGQLASGWVGGVDEPEMGAFGGPEGMDVAHDVFCLDSRAPLAETGTPGARERCVLLLSATLPAAGLDPFEAGGAWVKLGSLRPLLPRPPVLRPTAPWRPCSPAPGERRRCPATGRGVRLE